jgi:uncharacterized protein YeaO (DUF488 family)
MFDVKASGGGQKGPDMAIRIVQLGTSRLPDEGLRLGTVRRPPRGVPTSQFGSRNFYDVWVPELSPSPEVIKSFQDSERSDTDWRRLEKAYRSEMRQPERIRLLELLAALSAHTNFSVGCYCEDERRCHRSVLKKILREHGAEVLD